MDIFITGYVLGLCTVIAAGIFIWAVRRGKEDPPESLKGRVDRNNSDTGSGLEKLRENNSEAGRVAAGGLETIEDTNRTVSEIIASAKRDGRSGDKG